MRSNEMTISPPSAATAAPTRPVRPPCGTTAMRSAWQNRISADISSTVDGRATASGRPKWSPDQSRL
ncbi:hypothetical protein ACVILI_002318 [Mesorhizobium sp. USDA 4775]